VKAMMIIFLDFAMEIVQEQNNIFEIADVNHRFITYLFEFFLSIKEIETNSVYNEAIKR
jgi:hypothetical protein